MNVGAVAVSDECVLEAWDVERPSTVMSTAEAVAVATSLGLAAAYFPSDRDVLSLLPGHCLGLVGRNGAGKSTLVSILSGILPPDAGQVLFDGQPAPSDTAGWRGRIATVFPRLS